MKNTPFSTILTGLAFSPNLKPNVFEAMRLASFFNARLYFIHVGEKTKEKEEEIKTIIASCTVKPIVIEVLWEKGKPVKTILEVCKKKSIDLLLLGALQRETMLTFYIGSIARKITRKAPCSVLLLINPSIVRNPAQHLVVSAFDDPQTEYVIQKAFEVANAIDLPKVTLVEENNLSEINIVIDDDKSLREATVRKEKIRRREKSRVNQILEKIPTRLKEEKQISSQQIFGARGYSIGHYASVVRSDLVIMAAPTKKGNFFSRIFLKDVEYLLSELPTDLLIIHPSKQ